MQPVNPNGRPNTEVIKRRINGKELLTRPVDGWVIDFDNMDKTDAAFFEAPFEYVLKVVKPVRDMNRDRQRRDRWWLFGRSHEELRAATDELKRFIVTPRVAKHRLIAWMEGNVVPDTRLCIVTSDNDSMFGILHSRFHGLWSMRTCSWHGDGDDGGRPTYNTTTCFETFPFPAGLTPNIPSVDYADNPHAQAIAIAARRLVELRDNWLNPPEWVQRVPEVVPGYPDRILPKNEAAAAELKKRTLTNLYNARPAWLNNAHRTLDEAVAAAYGWDADISDDEVCRM